MEIICIYLTLCVRVQLMNNVYSRHYGATMQDACTLFYLFACNSCTCELLLLPSYLILRAYYISLSPFASNSCACVHIYGYRVNLIQQDNDAEEKKRPNSTATFT